MLVLSRKVDEEIVIDDRIVITIIEMSWNKVRIGISAPPDVRIYRKEVWDKIKSEIKIAK